MMMTLGAPSGALTSKRGGGVALRTSSTVEGGYSGSGIGSTVRSNGGSAVAVAAHAALNARPSTLLVGWFGFMNLFIGSLYSFLMINGPFTASIT
jgi:hypothetical protein